jgi:hypothetical protein
MKPNGASKTISNNLISENDIELANNTDRVEV